MVFGMSKLLFVRHMFLLTDRVDIVLVRVGDCLYIVLHIFAKQALNACLYYLNQKKKESYRIITGPQNMRPFIFPSFSSNSIGQFSSIMLTFPMFPFSLLVSSSFRHFSYSNLGSI